MIRREFLRSGAALTVIAALPRGAFADTLFTPKPDAWRKFEVTTRVEIVKPSGKAQVWLPLPGVAEPTGCNLSATNGRPMRNQRC
jgi:hypothetical protein